MSTNPNRLPWAGQHINEWARFERRTAARMRPAHAGPPRAVWINRPGYGRQAYRHVTRVGAFSALAGALWVLCLI